MQCVFETVAYLDHCDEEIIRYSDELFGTHRT